jgi:hypothetical protein
LRDCHPERLGGLDIDDQIKFRGLLYCVVPSTPTRIASTFLSIAPSKARLTSAIVADF